ncbi:aldo/keto reductase [Mesorhizobium sp. LHD-90]|uniref:aldo/keto reductase n=1 Tax=Mesorhizobium sp. LHD-90 TaxID=3071414 RepID=UPI0027E173BE|nr:aldo/keto reductase [Mesorhizobium sp. LHD-90]MDQ6435678.1 aldo/keto reductase [Mesorhizobium sp. LHD-90]
MTKVPAITFNDGKSIPQIGLGVWQTPDEVADSAVAAALGAGYRHVDTAAIYGNERGVARGISQSGVARADVFVTTKLWNADQGFDSALRAFDKSLERLGTDYIDLYLIHWPSPQRNAYADSWKALVRLKEEGRARSIGVSNFQPEHLQRIVDETGVSPALNQIELHPRFQQRDLRAAHEKLGVATESWSPLGSGRLLGDAAIGKIASKHGRSLAQVIIRWHLQQGLIVIPKSVTAARIVENFDVFDFTLDAEDMAAFAALDSENGRTGPNPLTTTF